MSLIQEKKYHLFQNILYVYKGVAKHKPYLIALLFVSIISTAGSKFIWLFLSKYIIEFICDGMAVSELVQVVVLLTIANVLCMLGQNAVNFGKEPAALYVRPMFMLERNKKHMNLPYECLEYKEILDAIQKSRKATNWVESGIEGIIRFTLTFCSDMFTCVVAVVILCRIHILDYAYNEYIKMLSVVFQDFKLFGYTLDENICMGVTDRNPADYSAADREKIYEISGIAPWVKALKKQGDTLLGKEFDPEGVEPSGGQAQKIAIARALYRDAPLVILDEPTAALDPVAEYEIYHHFHKMVQNKTAIYISHRLSSCKFCDRIVVLGGNRIQEMGSHDELMEKEGVYAKLFQTQAKWYVSEGGLQ